MELILADIRALVVDGRVPLPSTMKKTNMALFKEVTKRFGSWNVMLNITGLVAAKPMRKRARAFTKESLIAKLQEAALTVSPLLQTSIMKLPGCTMVGKYVIEYFGSWNEALQAAGLPAPEPSWKAHLIPPVILYPDAASVIAAIRARAEQGLSLLKRSLIVKKAEGGNLNLDRSAKRFFGGWRQAVEAAGLLEKNVPVVSRRFWNMEDVVAEFRRRHDAGLPVAGAAMHKGPHKDSSLIGAAKRFFGSHRAALEVLGYPVGNTRVPHFTKEEAVAELQRRHRAGVRPGGRALQTSNATGRRLHDDLIGFFGTWKAVLEAAGIPLEDTRPPHPRHRFDNKMDIIAALRKRITAGQPVDLKTMNLPVSEGGDTSLVHYAREHYRSWGDAVREAQSPAIP